MAGQYPTFITGATAKVRLNGKTIAFCQDFHCSIHVLTQTPKVLGKYEADSVEPLGYMVNGGFSIIRYAKGIQEALNNVNPLSTLLGGTPHGLAANDAGNGVGNWGTQWGGKAGDFLARNGIGNDGRAHEALDPSKFGTGTTFDIQIYQKVPVAIRRSTDSDIQDVFGAMKGQALPWEDKGPGTDYLGVLNVRNARITQADFALQKRAPATERFTFVAIYADGDGFVANTSG